MRIWCQLPVNLPRNEPRSGRYYEHLEKHYGLVKRKDTELVIRDVPDVYWKPEWQQYSGLRTFNNIDILKSVLTAEKEGVDGVSIACFLDPAFREARQLLKMPVTALAETSLHLACMMGSKFAIVVTNVHYIPVIQEHIARYGVESKAIRHNPVRALTLPKEETGKIQEGIFNGTSQDYAPLVENFKEIASGCIEDGAEVLIMGCGLLSPVLMQAGLVEVNGAAMIEPMQASLKLTEMLVDMHKAGIPVVSRKSSYIDVLSKDIADVLASRG